MFGILEKLGRYFFLRYGRISYSQEGEDLVLDRFFGEKENGFYVDVGAHHPIRFSNTYFFYRKGWRGINIDAMPGSMELFHKYRSGDVNIECPISDTCETLTYYKFNDPALNGFSEELTESRAKKQEYQLIGKEDLKTKTLAEVLKQYISGGKKIDFLSVDVEGYDFKVIQSNDWSEFRPEYVLVEILGLNLNELSSSDIYEFLCGEGYEVVAKTMNTVFFRAGG